MAAQTPQKIPTILIQELAVGPPFSIIPNDGFETSTTPRTVSPIILESNQVQSSPRQMQAKSETKTGDVNMTVDASASGIK